MDKNYVTLSPEQLEPSEMYFLLRDSIIPRPIAWISTVNEEGKSNIAPFSFFNVCCPSPPIFGFSCGPRGDDHNNGTPQAKDTLINIRTSKQFVVNLSPEGLFEQMVASAQDLPFGQSEFDLAGLTEVASSLVKPPRVRNSPISYECELYDILDLGANKWVMGSVIKIHIDQRVYRGEREGKRHRIDLLEDPQLRPIGRLGRAFYHRLTEVVTKLRKDGPN